MKINVQEAANRILANVEANERQIKTQIEQTETQMVTITSNLEKMKEALKEVEVLKCTLIMIGTRPEVAAHVSDLLSSSVDPTNPTGVGEAANG